MAQDKSEIFRKVALERLSSPEQLDVIMRVTGPRTWIALAALVVLLTVTVIWSVVGTIPTRVRAQGILIKPGGVLDVYASSSGLVADVSVKEGDLVAKGQIVARIDQPDLARQIEGARAELHEFQAKHRELAAFATKDQTLRAESRALEEATRNGTIAFAEERLTALRDQIKSQEVLLEKGLITRQSVLATQQELYRAQDMLEQARSQLKQIPLDRLTMTTRTEQGLVESQLRINEAERLIARLEGQNRMMTTVTSPYAGRVLEIKRVRGGVVAAGTPVVSLQLLDAEAKGLQAVIYIPSMVGKRVKTGMAVQISPSNVAREEFGFLRGRVTYVSEFPATNDGMMRVLANQSLVQSLAQQGPPHTAYADLEADPGSASGYLWSSPKGSPLAVDSGTLCVVTITVREQRPIEMVLPILRRASGL